MIADKKNTETDRQTDRHAHHNTALPYRGLSKYDMFSNVLLCEALAAEVTRINNSVKIGRVLPKI